MELSYVISLLLFGSLLVYFFFGVYIFSLHRSSALHRVFFLLCLSLGIWALSYSVANCAPNYEICFFWRRMAVFGWGFVYTFLLHFIIILTEKKEWLRKKTLYVLLYFPCAINVYANFLNSKIVSRQYELIRTYAGWINVSEKTGWDLFFYCYYIVFTLTSIILLWQWARKTGEVSKQKQARLIIASYLIALVAGSFAEVIINSVSEIKVPQIAPIIITIPLSVMFYSIIKYDLLPPVTKEKHAPAGVILSEATSSKMYAYLSFTYIVGAFASFGLQYFFLKTDPNKAFLLALPIFVFGVLIYATEMVTASIKWRTTLRNIIILVSIPVMNLLYIGHSAVFGWIFPAIILLISIVSNQKYFIAAAGTCIIFTLLFMWVLEPTVEITTDAVDHTVRICVFIILIWIAHFIKQAYTERLTQYEEQVEMQKINAKVSAGLVNVNEYNINEKLNETIRICGEYLRADFAELIFFEERALNAQISYHWSPTKSDLSKDGSFKLDDAEISIAMVGDNKVIGRLSFSTFKKEKKWNGHQHQLMRMISDHLTDVWLKVNAEKELKHMAYFDSLTSLPNRTQFSRYLKTAIEEAAASKTILGVIYLDLDFFKTMNDLMGHDSGDELLKQFAARLLDCLREEDLLARFGGDEFLIMLPHFTEIQDIQKVAERIMAAARNPLKVKDQELFMTASMGIAVFPNDGETAEDLIKNADLALYTSKETGRSKYTICSQDIKKEFVKKNELTSSLYLALERNEFLLYYQPKVDPQSGEILGVEALLRWQHPQKGLVLPGVIIPLAEKIGVIQYIDQWVLRTACLQLKTWQEQGLPPIKLAVNFSLSNFYSENVRENIWNVLHETGLDPALIEIEITESIAYYRPEVVIEVLGGLKSLGVSISIDDFGTEYSSLIRLQNLPIDRIKIDRQFVREISTKKGENIIRAIATLSNALDMKVTAEGVETKEQLAFAKDIGCDEIQGYYFYKPMPPKEIEVLLKQTTE